MKHLRLAAATVAAALLVTACADAGSITSPDRVRVQKPRLDAAQDTTTNRDNGGMAGGGVRTATVLEDNGGMFGGGGFTTQVMDNGAMTGGEGYSGLSSGRSGGMFGSGGDAAPDAEDNGGMYGGGI